MTTIRALAATALVSALAASPLRAATITVTTAADTQLDDAHCSLREAIAAANLNTAFFGCSTGNGADRIVFNLPTPATIALGAGLPIIDGDLMLQGPGPELLTIDGQNAHPLIFFDGFASSWLGVADLTLARGVSNADGDGGAARLTSGKRGLFRRVYFIDNLATNAGGAVSLANHVSARFEECWFSGNEAQGPAGDGALSVYVDARAEIDRSSFSDNFASHVNGNGGAIGVTNGSLRIDSSTFSGNRANDSGGAISLTSSSPLSPTSLSLRNSTVTRNQADADGVGTGDGGGIENGSPSTPVAIELGNSIVADNLDSGATIHPDLSLLNVTLTTLGYNIVGSRAGATAFFAAGLPNAQGDYVGTAAAPIDPGLGTLALFGGLTPSHRPILDPLSPALDKGWCAGVGGDQRGRGDAVNHWRKIDLPDAPNGLFSDTCDIGSHERGGDPNSSPALFSDSFEVGHTLLWSAERP